MIQHKTSQIQTGGNELLTVVEGLSQNIIERITLKQKKLHSGDDQPAFIRFARMTKTSGFVTEIEAWFKDGRLHRETGPAFIERSLSTGLASVELWYHEDKLLCLVEYCKTSGKKKREQFFNQKANSRGSRSTTYDNEGNIVVEIWQGHQPIQSPSPQTHPFIPDESRLKLRPQKRSQKARQL